MINTNIKVIVNISQLENIIIKITIIIMNIRLINQDHIKKICIHKIDIILIIDILIKLLLSNKIYPNKN